MYNQTALIEISRQRTTTF